MNAIPSNAEAERGALACVLAQPDHLADLRPELFHDLRHQLILSTLSGMARRGAPVTLASVGQALGDQRDQAGGLAYLVELSEATPSPAAFSGWLAELERARVRREVQRIGFDFAQNASAEPCDPDQLLDNFEREALGIRRDPRGGEAGIKDLVQSAVGELEKAHQNQGKLPGLPSGLASLDRASGGFRPGHMTILAARPAVGKTSLAMQIAEHVAVDLQEPVGVFSLEMTGTELVLRMQCSRARVPASAAQDGALSERDLQALTQAGAALANSPLHLCDQAGLTLPQIVARARRWKARHDIRLLVIDYLGLVAPSERRLPRYEHTSQVSAGLKALAKELDVSALVLCQLNRNADNEGRKPGMADLRDSGQIEADADRIWILHRGANDTIELNQCKNRHGRTAQLSFDFLGRFTRLEEARP